MIEPLEVLRALYFFVPAFVANMAPVLVHGHFESLAKPIDGGCSWRGQRIFGDHKTWRGIAAGATAGVLVFELQRCLFLLGIGEKLAAVDYGAYALLPGLLMGIGAGVGDAVKSFFKRRVGIEPGGTWLVFDQVDFLVGAYLFVVAVCAPSLAATAACIPVVFAGSIAVTAIGYGLGLKEAWI